MSSTDLDPKGSDRPGGTIRQIARFPVKSMQGETLDRVELGPHGIVGDRVLGVRDLVTGMILSAKKPNPGQALLSCHARHDDASSQVVVTVEGVEYGHRDDAAALDRALSDLLGRSVALVAAGGEGERYASEWPEIEGMLLSGAEIDLDLPSTSFADLAPLHLLTTSSLARLAALAPASAIDERRFRPGLLIDSSAEAGFVENGWEGQVVAVGTATLTMGAASPRCIMTTLAQPGLEADREVLRALARHNRGSYAGMEGFARLGTYADVTVPGTIAVGDEMVPVG